MQISGGVIRIKPSASVDNTLLERHNSSNHKKIYNFLDCDWFKELLFSTNSLAKVLSDSLLLNSLLLDSLSSDSSMSQSHSKL